MKNFAEQGWAIFEPEPALVKWSAHTLDAARAALEDPGLDHWYQCERTWFVGLEALPNDRFGRLPDGPPLQGAAIDFAAELYSGLPVLHAAQLSGVFPGYPRPRSDESDAAFRYRRDRDAAHVDGVLGEGTPKRRFVREPHAFILGLPLTDADRSAAPLVVWSGSHLLMQQAFALAFEESGQLPPESVDVTETYVAARRAAFATCERVTLAVPPGGAMLLHRLLLHGVAPFQTGAQAAAEGRLIAYFRPPMPGGAASWASMA
ncbi:MAG: hypothetical protein AAF636_23175 [Pseudomonadota bacterium]